MGAHEDYIRHFGVKGMKWGVRRASTSGGGQPHEDAAKAVAAKVKLKSSGLQSLSNQELKTLVDRMNLERQYSQLDPKTNHFRTGQKVAKEVLSAGATVNNAIAFAKSPAGQAIAAQLAKK